MASIEQVVAVGGVWAHPAATAAQPAKRMDAASYLPSSALARRPPAPVEQAVKQARERQTILNG